MYPCSLDKGSPEEQSSGLPLSNHSQARAHDTRTATPPPVCSSAYWHDRCSPRSNALGHMFGKTAPRYSTGPGLIHCGTIQHHSGGPPEHSSMSCTTLPRSTRNQYSSASQPSSPHVVMLLERDAPSC